MLKKIGNWAKAAKVVANLKKEHERIKEDFLDLVAEKGLDIVVGHIDKQDLPWRPLSESYLMEKRAQGYQSEIYIRTKKFYDSLAIKKFKNGRFVGIPKGIQTDKGDKMEDLARIHEFGALSVGIYARPLFGPSATELEDYAKKNTPEKKLKDRLDD